MLDAAQDDSKVMISGANRHDGNIIWRSFMASQAEERQRLSVLVNRHDRDMAEIAGVREGGYWPLLSWVSVSWPLICTAM